MKSVHFELYLLPFLAMLVMVSSSLFPTPSYAQTDAYSIEVAVSERSEEEQQNAYRAALRRVLLNNSGDKTILNRDLIRQNLQQAERFVQSFSYRRPPPGTVIASDTPITNQVQQSGQATQLMLVSFDRQLVNQLIAGNTASGAQESVESVPADAFAVGNSAMLWLLISDDGRDILISDDAAVNVQNRAREIAGAAGISLVYPAGDEEDQRMLSRQDISTENINADNLANISERYGQKTLLIGYLTRMGAVGWRGQWTQYAAGQLRQSQFNTASLDQGLQSGLGVLSSVADIDESFRYGGSSISDTEALLWVGSIDSTEDYANMMRFLEAVPSVATVYPKVIETNSMVFSVVPRSAITDIELVLSDTQWLRRSSLPVNSQPSAILRNIDLAIDYGR